MKCTKENILNLLDRKIHRREQTFKGFLRNPVNIKEKRKLQTIKIKIVVLKALRRQVNEVFE